MIIVLLFAIAGVALVAFIYPYLIYPLILARLPAVASIASPPSAPATFALLFCAYNERAAADEKLQNLLALKTAHPDLQMLVYDDGSTDGTAEMFSSHPDLVTVVRGAGRRGKAHGMKTLVRQTDRSILVFTDANVLLAPDAVEQLALHFDDPSVGGVCGHIDYGSTQGTTTERVGGAYWSLDERLKALESRTGNVMGGDGSIFAVRRELYPHEFSDSVQDDFLVTMNVTFGGSRLVYAPEVVVSERLVARRGDEYRRKVRISARAFRTHLSMREDLRRMSRIDRWKYASHKVLRWFGAAALFVGAAAFVAALALMAPWLTLAMIALSVGLGALTSRTRVMGAALEVVLALTATLHGVLLAMRGRTFVTWTPPQSR